MNIPPQNFYCLIWSYRFNVYKARGWTDGTAGFFAGINAFGVYLSIIMAPFFIFFLVLGYAGIHINAFFVVMPVVAFFAYYTSYKDKSCRALYQSMNPPGPWVYFALFLYVLCSVIVPLLFSIVARSNFIVSILTSFLCIVLSVSIADHWAAGKIRQLQAARAAELHGKHASR